MILREFLKFINLEGVLLEEGIKQARELYQRKFNVPLPKYLENQIINIDPSQNKKYAEWIVRVSPDFSDLTLNKIKELLSTFHNLVSKNIITKEKSDINRYKSVEELEELLKQYENVKTKTEVKKEIKSEGAKKVFENDKVVIYQILNFEASCIYGRDTRWCISASDKPEEGLYSWQSYSNENNIYFIISKNPTYNNLDKLAVLENKKSNFIVEVFNQIDQKILPSQFIQVIKQNNLPIKYLTSEEFNSLLLKNMIPSQFKQICEIFFSMDLIPIPKRQYFYVGGSQGQKQTYVFFFNFKNNFEKIIINNNIIKNDFNDFLKKIKLDNNNNYIVNLADYCFCIDEDNISSFVKSLKDFKTIDNFNIKFEYIFRVDVSFFFASDEEQELIKYFITKTMKDALIPIISYKGLKAENLINLIPSKNLTTGMRQLILENCELKSLEGCPSKIIHYFEISKNDGLKNLIGAPKKVDSMLFSDFKNNISFEGFPQKVSSLKIELSFSNYKILFKNVKYLPKFINKIDIEIEQVPTLEEMMRIKKEIGDLIEQNCKPNQIDVYAHK